MSFRFLFFFSCYADHRDLHSFLHDALPIWPGGGNSSKCMPLGLPQAWPYIRDGRCISRLGAQPNERSEEHTSELQSRGHLVCRLLLEKKKTKQELVSTQGQ